MPNFPLRLFNCTAWRASSSKLLWSKLHCCMIEGAGRVHCRVPKVGLYFLVLFYVWMSESIFASDSEEDEDEESSSSDTSVSASDARSLSLDLAGIKPDKNLPSNGSRRAAKAVSATRCCAPQLCGARGTRPPRIACKTRNCARRAGRTSSHEYLVTSLLPESNERWWPHKRRSCTSTSNCKPQDRPVVFKLYSV